MNLHWGWKALFAGVGFIAAREIYLAVGPRRTRRMQVFQAAKARATSLGLPLIVIGDPHAGLVSRLVGPSHGCGDACFDPHGCGQCARQQAGAIEDLLPNVPTRSAVVFATGLETVSNIERVLGELMRISAGNLYIDAIPSVTLTAWFAPGAKRRFHEVPPDSDRLVWSALPWVQERSSVLPAATAREVEAAGFIDVDGEAIT